MRVIAGEYGGRPLKAPKGSGTRPTTDRIKESLMSSLLSILGSFEGMHVLDAFAGSGGLGIECLSRGAASVAFFDKDRNAINAVKDNLASLRIGPGQAIVRMADALGGGAVTATQPFDLVLLDPPYAYSGGDILDFVANLATRGQLNSDAVIVYEHDSNASIDALVGQIDTPPSFGTLEILKSKRHGVTQIDIMRFSD